MKMPKHPPAVHICLFNGRWRAVLNRAELVGVNRLNLEKAFAYCKERNAAEGRPETKTKRRTR